MLIPRFRDIKLPKYDDLAARQIFDKVHDRSDGRIAAIEKDTQNPIDIKLRQLALSSLDGKIDLKKEFLGKNVVVIVGDVFNIKMVKGKIADMYLVTRDLRLRTRKNETIIVPFDKVMYYGEREV